MKIAQAVNLKEQAVIVEMKSNSPKEQQLSIKGKKLDRHSINKRGSTLIKRYR